jgi:hypothetical protein
MWQFKRGTLLRIDLKIKQQSTTMDAGQQRGGRLGPVAAVIVLLAVEMLLLLTMGLRRLTSSPVSSLLLRNLLDMIVDVKKRMELSRAAEERATREAKEGKRERVTTAEAAMEEGRLLLGAEVLRRAAAVDSTSVKAAMVGEDNGALAAG